MFSHSLWNSYILWSFAWCFSTVGYPGHSAVEKRLLYDSIIIDEHFKGQRCACGVYDALQKKYLRTLLFCVCKGVEEQIGPKCQRFFSLSNFMKFEKDESGRIAILPFFLYVIRTVGLAFLCITMSCFLYVSNMCN
ncbi:hypothetical protein HYC85_022321 [Camellia sinensis]|uniref:Uncharacterized protein n=1 Tax=Camellia sinensis TaxID=4442 RepID=A0A7J7GP04_CAMSI|nr:hypothetical protein HYC85_022321 [Camellia sinensis]